MLDIKFIRENKDLVIEAASKKFVNVDIDKLLSLDEKRIKLLQEVEARRNEQNKASEKIATSTGNEKLISQMKILKLEMQRKEVELKKVTQEWQKIMLSVPNIPDVSVPVGKSDEDNTELRKVGDIPKFSFTPKNHIDLLKRGNMADFERGTKVSGFRGYFLKNDALVLQMALWQFVMNFFKDKGYEFLMSPSIVNKEGFLGTGYLPDGEEDLYKTQDDSYLSGTSEVPVMASFMGEVLSKEILPKKVIAFSPCFRREAGSHGKDTKGLVRVHEFFKWEQVALCEASHEESVKLHEELQKNAEELMQALKIPYRVVINCGGDLGLGQVKKYDIEAWVPSEERYVETHSVSYFHDFQARRLNIKYKDDKGKNNFVHSLNGTALASPRILVPLLENYQKSDGTIKIPDVLIEYIGKENIGG